MSTAEISLQNVRGGERFVFGLKHVPSILLICLVMVIAIIYVWPHINMTELEYQIAEEISKKQRLLEERGKFKIEYATLKSPQRIENLAREKMHMSYPERDQVIYLK